jgi:uncharacterized protein
MEVLCRLSYSGLLPCARAMIPAAISRGSMGRVHRVVAIVLALTCAACTRASGDPASSAELTIRTNDGSVTLAVEVADTPQERAEGLMGRATLPPNAGMAFVWPEPTRGSFWMKDTLIPLSIGFWDEDGRIVSVLEMDPCHADPCPSYDPGVEYAGAVEVNQGYFRAHGVETGDVVELTTASA